MVRGGEERGLWQTKLFAGDVKPGSAARTLDFVASLSLLHLRFTHQQVCQRTTSPPRSLFYSPCDLSPARTIEF